MDDYAKRLSRAAESLLENETVTADLDTEAANALLAWGQDCVERIVRDSVGLGDAAAEEAIALRLKAMRRLMRQVNRWVAGQKAAGADLVQPPWPKMLEQAAIIYGQDYALPEAGQLEMFLAQNATLLSHPEQLIVSLRQYIERFNKEQST